VTTLFVVRIAGVFALLAVAGRGRSRLRHDLAVVLYQQATKAARPAVLALGDVVVHVQDMIALISFVITFG
jgi:hypothetical protein